MTAPATAPPGAFGPAELTMRNLAAHLQVSPRALYNYVADRDDLLREVIDVCQAARPQPRLDPERWRESLAGYCRELRAWYRAHPGMLALARAEDLTHLAAPGLLRADDALVGFFLDIGLGPRDAYRAWTITVLQVAGFAEVWDSWHDHPPAVGDTTSWTGAPVGNDTPHLRRLADAGVPESPDVLFESVITMLTAGIAALLP
ncbi:TetR/AcrR family transcriptional regulator [Nonomuraea sp. NPDC046802]|uniref:TetR/AcrR family transcriptional regulator n=1 Tax=Nonomuraea sp. NPDC046802 TaxID=3154919 RepID=UPI0033F28011